MRFRDSRSITDQIKSGVRITGALLLSLAVISAFIAGYRQLTGLSVLQNVWYGSLLLFGVSILLVATVQYWRLWFPAVPGFFGLRLIWGFFFGWFASDLSGLWYVLFPLLMLGMSGLSIRFSRKQFRMRRIDRAVLFMALICLLLAMSNLLLSGLTRSVVVVSLIGDGILILSWLHSRRPRSLRSAERSALR